MGMASKALKHADLSKIDRKIFGQDPGALLCSKQLTGKIVWSKDTKGNERTFCLFKDGTLVGTGSLDHAGSKKIVK